MSKKRRSRHRFIPLYTTIRATGIRAKTKDLNKPTEYRDNSRYWRKRLIAHHPTHFYKYDYHGLRSPIFKIIKIEIVDSPQKYISEGVLHTKKAIMMIGEAIEK